MSRAVFQLYDDFRDRWRRGEWPDAADYLERAGDDADALALLIDAYLERAEPPPARAEAVALVEAWASGEPPLLELRTRRGLRRDAVVDFLIRTLGLDPRKRQKVKRYYHELETGRLDPEGLSPRLRAALAKALDARIEDLLGWRPQSLQTQVAFFRADAMPAAPAPAQAEEEYDEIDELFRGAQRR